MLNRRTLRGWRHTIVNLGWTAFARGFGGQVRRRLTRTFHPWQAAEVEREWPTTAHPFDAEHGVDTSGLIWGEELASGSRNDTWNTAYYGIAPSVFHTVMAELPPDVRTGATFIDIGSGKGRAVMLASRYPFARAIGVEISPELHRIAQQNIATFAGKAPAAAMEVVLSDAVRYSFPPGPLVVYLFHPFCRPVLEQVIQNLGRSLSDDPRPAAVVYINAELRDVLDRSPLFERVWGGLVDMDAADLLADRLGSNAEDCAVYRSTVLDAASK